MKAGKFKNTKSRLAKTVSPLLFLQPFEQAVFSGSLRPFAQEAIDFKTLFRYKKTSTEKEEACQWDR